MITKKCLWCGKAFQLKRKRVALCESCRAAKDRLGARERDRQRRDDRSTLLNAVLPTLPAELHPRARSLADECLTRSDALASQVAHDIQPPGTKSAPGADEGHTSEFEDLRNWLDHLSAAAAKEPWWQLNPPEDVFFQLGADDRRKPGKLAAAA